MGVTCRLKELKCPDINICSCSRAVDESFERYDMLKLVCILILTLFFLSSSFTLRVLLPVLLPDLHMSFTGLSGNI